MKKQLLVISLIFLLCFTFACQDKEAMGELEAMKAQAEVEEQNKDLVKRYVEEWNKGNIENYMDFYAPDWASYVPSNSPKPGSREEEIESTKMIFRAFPDFNGQRIY